MRKIIAFLITAFFFSITQAFPQAVLPTAANPTLTIPKISEPPKIDGLLDDACWSETAKITNFFKFFPVDGEPASEKAEAFLAYDAKYLYIAFRCYDTEKRKIRANLTKRDEIFSDDRVGILLDTFNSQRRVYWLECNPFGVQADAFWVEGKRVDFNLDLIFTSEGKLNSDGYTVEFAIPFKSLRFPAGKTRTMGFGLRRGIQRKNEWVFWPPMDRSKNTILTQLAQITGIEGIEDSRNIEILPTFTSMQTGEVNGDGVFENGSIDPEFGIGLKYGITPNITVDFTYNPDFSQVEADVGQVDVNQRYELYFPEKRPFFAEGADIFSTDIETVYSRRIIEPIWGAKITGKIGKATFGFLSALDEGPGREWSDEENPHLGEKALFNIVRGKYDLFGTSYLGFLMTSRQFADSSNQVVGIDGSFNFKQKYRFNFQGLGSYTTEEGEKLSGPAFKADFSRQSRHLFYTFSYRDLYPDFRADAGFIRRTDIREGAFRLGYRFLPNKNWILTYTPNYAFSRFYDHNGNIVEQLNEGSIWFQLAKNTFLNLSISDSMERWVDIDYKKKMFQIFVNSSPTRYISASINFYKGEGIYYDEKDPYLGYRRFMDTSITIRPNIKLKEELSYIKSTFWKEKDGEVEYDYNIIRSKTTYQFTKKLSLRSILQYNAYYKELCTDILLSYMHNYGTVFFLGYGSIFDRENDICFRQNRRSFFVKLSYLWRL